MRGSNLCSTAVVLTVSGLLVSLLDAELADWKEVAGFAEDSGQKMFATNNQQVYVKLKLKF